MDIDAHRYGANKFDLVQWLPNSATAQFQVRNVRYYFDNAVGNASFDAAYQWEGVKGTGELMVLPLDTRSAVSTTIEISNTGSAQVTAQVNLYSTYGSNLKSLSYPINRHASLSIPVVGYMAHGEGVATIKGSTAGSLVATVTQVAQTSVGKIKNLYAIQGTQPLGSAMRGSYNTFLSQKCSLLLANPTNAPVNTYITMKRFDGKYLLIGQSVSVAAHGLVDYDLCINENQPAYGLVTVQPSVSNSIQATVLRLGAGDAYRFPTPVRE